MTVDSLSSSRCKISVDGSKSASFLRGVKYGIGTEDVHVSPTKCDHDDSGDSSLSELGGVDFDYRDWYPFWDTSILASLSHFFLKPKLKFEALPPMEYQTKNVTFLDEKGKVSNLGPKKAFLTYLKLQNNGRADAKDCTVTNVPSAATPPSKHFFPVELPLTYAHIPEGDLEITAGKHQPYTIAFRGDRIHHVSRETIPRNGGQTTVLLAFTIESVDTIFLGVASGASGLDLTPFRLTLRTSVDGKLHHIELKPTPNGSVEAQVLG